MAAKVPIRAVFDGSTATGLAEFQSAEFIALAYGGLGASLSIGSAGQVLKVNSGASALEFGAVEAILNIDGMTDGSGITIADSDKFAASDGGTEKYVLASQIKTYLTGAGATAITALDIDGGTDIGAAIVDADLFIVDDGAGGTNRKTAASRIATYVGASAGAFSITNLDIDGGTDIGAAIVDADLFIVDDGAGGTNRKVAASRIKTYVHGTGAVDITTLDIDGGTDIGAAIVDADLFVIDDGAGGTNRKTAASRIATYVGASAGAFSLANLDIDGGTDIGAAIVDADLFIVDDGAGGTNRKVTASRLKTYVEDAAGEVPIANLNIDGGTDIGAAIVDADLFIVDDGAGGTNRKTTAARLKTYVGGGGAYFLGGASGATGDTTNGLEDIFRINSATADTSCTIASGTNASASGPLTVSSGVTITVGGLLAILDSIIIVGTIDVSGDLVVL